MIKRIFIFLVTIVLLFSIGVFLHEYLNSNMVKPSKFSVLAIYSFHAIASSIVYLLIEVCFKFLPSQSGYSFLALMTIKLGVFMLLFSSKIYTGVPLNFIEKTILLVPLFIFLITETVALATLMNNAKFSVHNDD